MLKQSRYNMVCYEDEGRVLLYNTLTQGVCRISKDIAAKISDSLINESDLEDNVREQLQKQGFIAKQDVDELNQVLCEEKSHIWDNHRDALSFVIAPTLKCNYR